MTPKPTLTVLMAVYNDKYRVGQAIESILAQSFRSLDLLIVDDGSTDGTDDLIRAYAARESRIRTLRLPENSGLGAALQAGLGETSADLIARMDSDDISHPERLARQVAMMERHGLDVLGAAQDRGKRRVLGALKPEALTHATIVRALPHHNVLVHPSVMFRLSTVRPVEGYDPRFIMAQDYDLWLRLIGLARFGNLPDKLIVSPANPDRASGPRNRLRHTVFSVTAAANHFRRKLGMVGLDPNQSASDLGRELVFLLDQVGDADFFDLSRHAIRLVRYSEPDPESLDLIKSRIFARAGLGVRAKWMLYGLDTRPAG